MTNLSRDDKHGNHCWRVRVTRQGKKHSKSFSDGTYGDSDKAYQAAVLYLEGLQIEPRQPRKIASRTHKCNTSGVVGVGEWYNRGVFYGYRVQWRQRGKMKSKYFSVRRYGDQAWTLAVALRKTIELRYQELQGAL